ncbi:hypothetical protein M758_9G046100, partial [Ceratodon purpureus]
MRSSEGDEENDEHGDDGLQQILQDEQKHEEDRDDRQGIASIHRGVRHSCEAERPRKPTQALYTQPSWAQAPRQTELTQSSDHLCSTDGGPQSSSLHNLIPRLLPPSFWTLTCSRRRFLSSSMEPFPGTSFH